MQASFFRYILNWTLYRISRKIKWNESQIFITGKLFLIRHPCHVLPFHVPYMSRPSLSCSLHVTSFLVLFLTCHVPSLSCSLHVTSFLVVFLTCHVPPCLVPYMSRSFLAVFLTCHVPSFLHVFVKFLPYQLSFKRSFLSYLSLSRPVVYSHVPSFLSCPRLLHPAQLFLSYYFLFSYPCHITSISAVPIILLPPQLFLSYNFHLSCPHQVTSF